MKRGVSRPSAVASLLEICGSAQLANAATLQTHLAFWELHEDTIEDATGFAASAIDFVARKHGVEDDETLLAITHAVARYLLSEEDLIALERGRSATPKTKKKNGAKR